MAGSISPMIEDHSSPSIGSKSKAKKRRPRGVIVCKNCRKRKVKCDKQKPCSNCIKFNQSDTCCYETQNVHESKAGYMEIQLPLPVTRDNTNNGRREAKRNSENGNVIDVKSKNNLSVSEFKKRRISDISELEHLKERIQQLELSLISNSSQLLSQADNRLITPAHGPAYNLPLYHLPTLLQKFTSPMAGPNPNLAGTVGPMSNASPNLPSKLSRMPSHAHAFNSNVAATLPPLNQPAPNNEEYLKRIQNSDPSLHHSQFPFFKQKPHLSPARDNSRIDGELRSMKDNSFSLPSRYLALPRYSEAPFMIGKNVVSETTDTINFYEGYSSIHYKDTLRRLNFGPFAWSSLMKRDIGLRITWDYVVMGKEKASSKGLSAALMFAHPSGDMTEENTATFISVEKDSEHLEHLEHLEKRFERRALQTDGLDDVIPYRAILQARNKTNVHKATLNKHALPLGLTVFDGKLDRELQLMEKIEVVLPKKRVLWKLVHRFFQSMYTYMPFVDEDYFRRDVEKIIGPQSYDDVSVDHIKIERKLDLATVGLLLIILRLAYLSLFSNNSSLNESILNNPNPNSEDKLLQYLMKNPININTIDVATLCLDQFQILRRSNFNVLQLALFLRLYHIFAPEDGDGADGGDSQVLNSVLIQTAFSLGVNREPDQQCTDLKLNHITRKIWKYLVASDLHLGYSFGNRPTIDDMHFDISDPICEPGSENIRDKIKDRATTENLNWCSHTTPKLRSILQYALDINGRISLMRLCQDVSDFELHLHDNMGTLGDFIVCSGMDDQDIAKRNLKVKVYLALKSFLISLYFHIYLYYETKDVDVSFFYLKKSLLTTIGDIMPHYVTLLGKSEVISDMIINPTLEMTIHKSNQINLSIIVRVNFLIFHLKQSPQHERLYKTDKSYFNYFQLLCQLSSAVTRAAEFTISAISKLSNRYYYAWRITRGQTFLLKTITLTQFYEENYHKASQVYSIRYKPEQIKELISICEETLSLFSQTEFCTYGFAKHMDEDLYKCNEPRQESIGNESNVFREPSRNSTNAEIDKIWLQVLSLKHNTTLAGNLQDAPLDSKAPIPLMSSTDFGYQPPQDSSDIDPSTGIDRFGYDMEMATRFDFFSEMPFEGMLDI